MGIKSAFQSLSTVNKIAVSALGLCVIFCALAYKMDGIASDYYSKSYDVEIQNAGTSPEKTELAVRTTEQIIHSIVPDGAEAVFVPIKEWDGYIDSIGGYCNMYVVKKGLNLERKYPSYFSEETNCKDFVLAKRKQKGNIESQASQYNSYTSTLGVTSVSLFGLFALLVIPQIFLILWRIFVRETAAAVEAGKKKANKE